MAIAALQASEEPLLWRGDCILTHVPATSCHSGFGPPGGQKDDPQCITGGSPLLLHCVQERSQGAHRPRWDTGAAESALTPGGPQGPAPGHLALTRAHLWVPSPAHICTCSASAVPGHGCALPETCRVPRQLPGGGRNAASPSPPTRRLSFPQLRVPRAVPRGTEALLHAGIGTTLFSVPANLRVCPQKLGAVGQRCASRGLHWGTAFCGRQETAADNRISFKLSPGSEASFCGMEPGVPRGQKGKRVHTTPPPPTGCLVLEPGGEAAP